MANNSPAVGAGNCQGQQAAQHQAGAAAPGQQQLQSGAPKPAASGKQGNVLPLWGNEKTMNLNPMILTNILSSPYFKVQLYELKTYHEVVDEIYFKVRGCGALRAGRAGRRCSPQRPACGLCLSSVRIAPRRSFQSNPLPLFPFEPQFFLASLLALGWVCWEDNRQRAPSQFLFC